MPNAEKFKYMKKNMAGYSAAAYNSNSSYSHTA
jgi:hypothetical protein